MSRFQQAHRRLNLVKAHAHEIVGVKREQVAMVVENFSRPGSYTITVHRDGKVESHQWTPPPADLQVPARFPVIDEDKAIDEVVAAMDGVELAGTMKTPGVYVVEKSSAPEELAEEAVLGEAEEVPPAPETPDAPRRRGRPKRS